MTNLIHLRDLQQKDLDIFFVHQQDPIAQNMAAFIHKDPSDRTAFDAHWKKIINNDDVIIQTILLDQQVVGHIAKFVMFNEPELTYWIGREFWGKGIATNALKLFLKVISTRPLYARTAKDNIGSTKVLEKCGFKVKGYTRGYANARETEIEEVIFKID